MNLINTQFSDILTQLVNFFFFFEKNFIKDQPELYLYVKFCVASLNFTIFVFVMLSILNFLSFIFVIRNSFITKIITFTNMFFMSFVTIILLIKLYISLKLEKNIGISLYEINQYNFMSNDSLYFKYINVFSSSFSDAVLLLCFITGIVCVDILGPKNLLKNINNLSIFYIFNIFVTIMISSNNLLVIFLSFEFIFLPTLYFVFKTGYSKKIDKAGQILLYWTLFGSFLVLCNLSYLYYVYNTLDFFFLSKQNFSNTESKVLFFNFFVGFGIKIPLVPFHFWLLKVHVESPTAFSIFLSGFLVKSALYCLFMLVSIINIGNNQFFVLLWVLYSLLISSLGLARQIDIKKLIAWATIQEMSFMLLFLLFKQFFLTHTCILFVVLHGLMSTYMFYIVDILQRRFKTRSILFIKGLNFIAPKMSLYIWFLILLFSGFPLTAKFIIEWNLMSLMINNNSVILICTIIFVNFLGTIFFCKIMFTILYGTPEKIKENENNNIEFLETQKKEYFILRTVILLILVLTFLIYILNEFKKI